MKKENIEKLYSKDYGKGDVKVVVKWLKKNGYKEFAKLFKKVFNQNK